MLTMHATVQQIPPDHTGTTPLHTTEVTAEADDYDTALGHVTRQVPDGWRIIALRVDRDPIPT